LLEFKERYPQYFEQEDQRVDTEAELAEGLDEDL